MPRIMTRPMTASLRFDGLTSRVNAAAITGLATGHSITGWIYIYDKPAGQNRVIANNIESASNLETVNLGDDLMIRAGYYNGTVYTRASSDPLTPGQWSFYVYTWNGTTARLRVNGVLQSGNLPPQSNTTAGLNMGARSDGTFLLSAALAETRYFNRPITDVEAAKLYASGIPPSGVVRQYLLNEGSGTVATDTSGSGVNGTITAPMWSTFTPTKARALAPLKSAITRTRRLVGEMVENGDFEYAPPFVAATTTNTRWIDGTASGSLTNSIYGWACHAGASSGAAEWQFDNTTSYRGLNSMKLRVLDNVSFVAVSNYRDVVNGDTKLFTLQPNTSYTLKARVKTSTVGTNCAYVRLRTVSGSKSIVATVNTNQLSGTNDWTVVTLTHTTGATVAFGSIVLSLDTGLAGTAWFDNISLMPTTPMTRQLVI